MSFAIHIVRMTEGMSTTPAGRYYGGQVLRSSGSAALNYGEAQGGESHRDFTHKLKIARKEMRESLLSIRIIREAALHPDTELLSATSDEVHQLLSILTAAVKTAEKRSPRK